MQVELTKKPKKVTIISGFPGFGLIGTITTEFLIEHLKATQIGHVITEDSPPIVAVHNNKVIEPLGIFYDNKHNIVIVHGLNSITGQEWKISEILVSLVKDLQAKELITLEGVNSPNATINSHEIFYIGNNKLEKIGLKQLKEGIIMGVAGALLLKKDVVPLTCLFAETHSNLPDSRSSAKVIQVLDEYLGLRVDNKPLLEQAKKFEEKLKGFMQQTKNANIEKEKKELNYLG